MDRWYLFLTVDDDTPDQVLANIRTQSCPARSGWFEYYDFTTDLFVLRVGNVLAYQAAIQKPCRLSLSFAPSRRTW